MKKSNVVVAVAERFSVDFISKKISGTKASFDKAKRGSGPIYEELARKVANHPDFNLVIEDSSKDRETYKGMDIPWMRAYIEMIGNQDLAKNLEKVILFAENSHKKAYPFAKKYFLKQFSKREDGTVNFDYKTARIEVEEYLVNKTMLEQEDASTDNLPEESNLDYAG